MTTLSKEGVEFRLLLQKEHERIVGRISQVGFAQASAELWEEAKRDIDQMSADLAQFRKEHGLSEEEL